MKAGTRTLLGCILTAAVLTDTDAEAKRLAPKEVVPVTADGVRYTAPHFGALRGRSQNGGYVEAKDARTGKLIWSRMIYRVQFDPNREKDVQDVFITKIEVRRGRLLVETERSEEFEMELSSGSVRALTRLGPAIEVSPSAQRQTAGQMQLRTARVVDDAKKSWTWIAAALSSSGYVADFTPASLWEIDRFFDQESLGGTARPGGLLSVQLGSRLFAIGAYLGEVIRRQRGGEWVGNDDDPEAEINIEVRLTDGGTFWPVQRAMKRFKNGPEDGIAAYGLALGLKVGPRPAAASRR